jgi:hypothetical protein
MLMLRIGLSFLAVTFLLAGCATQTASPGLTVDVPSVAADAKWTFSATTKWADPVRITLSINGSPLTGASEINPGSIIGAYQGHGIRAQCTTEWTKGAAFGSGSCYIYVDGVQTAILIL